MSHSATYTLPWPSTAMPWGLLNLPGLNRALGTNSPPAIVGPAVHRAHRLVVAQVAEQLVVLVQHFRRTQKTT